MVCVFNFSLMNDLMNVKTKYYQERSTGSGKKEQVIISSLRIGLANLNSTHFFIMRKHLTGCGCNNWCHERESEEHALIS